MHPQSPRKAPCRQDNANRPRRIGCDQDAVIGPVDQVQVELRKSAKRRLGDIRRVASHQGEMGKAPPQLGKGAPAAFCRDQFFKFDQFVFVQCHDRLYRLCT